MRLVGAAIETFGHVASVELPLGATTMLFGKNGAGKSTVLRALTAAWSDEADQAAQVSWMAELDEGDGPLLREILSDGAASTLDDLESLLDLPSHDGLSHLIDAADRLRALVPSSQDFRTLLSEVAGRLRPASSDDGASVALVLDSVLARPIVRFGRTIDVAPGTSWDDLLVGRRDLTVTATLVLDRRTLTEVTRSAWAQLAGEPSLDDTLLGTAARDVVGGDGAFVPVVDVGRLDGSFARPSARAMLGFSLVTAETDPTDLEEFVEANVEALFHAVVGVDDPDAGRLRFRQSDDADPWLEPLEDAEGVYRVRSAIEPILDLVSERANELAPPFATQAGSLRVTVNDPTRWPSAGRVSVLFESFGKLYRLDQLGTGTARWLAASLREAVRQLGRSRRSEVAHAESGMIWTAEHDEPHDALDDVLLQNFSDPPHPSHVELESPRDPGLLLIDEPELHLHPEAQGDVARWLDERAREGLTVVMATHSPAFLNPSAEPTEHLHVRATPEGPIMDRVSRRLVAFLQESAGEAGMSRADMLLVLRGLLVVEGQHDLLVVQHFFGQMLQDARMLPVRLQGTGNALAIIESDLMSQLGLKVRVVFDNVSADSLETHLPARGQIADEVRRARQIADLARERGLEIRLIPYEEPDVICALPAIAVKRAWPEAEFLDWPPLIERFHQLGLTGFKQWALVQIGLKTIHPTEFIRRTLELAEPADQARPAFSRAIREAAASIIEQPSVIGPT